MPKLFLRSLLTLACLAVFIIYWLLTQPVVRPSGFKVDLFSLKQSSEHITSLPYYNELSATDGQTREIHSVTGYLASDTGQVHAFWYGGTREGASDVCIYTASFALSSNKASESQNRGKWSASKRVICPEEVRQDTLRFTRKVGNPVSHQWPDGRVWLFFVSVSVGGWGGSSINLIESVDGSKSWSSVKKLVTSPFMNISTLVRGPAIQFTDGTIGLPVYHESIGKFGELLHLNRKGEVLGKMRLSHRSYSLQPVISPLNAQQAVGFMRYAGEAPERVLRFESLDGGKSWSKPDKLKLPNPDSAVASLALSDTEMLLVFNDTPNGRVDLALAYSSDRGKSWQRIHYLEFSGKSMKTHDVQFSYPSIIKDATGDIHVLYSHNRTSIKHVHFNQAWLREKIARLNKP